MPKSEIDGEQGEGTTPSLGDELRRIRVAKGLTLREVERRTGVSNAYLSQLETGKIERPAPSFLHRLAGVYDVPYELLMERAGYIKRQEKPEVQKRSLSGAALASIEDLTPDEEAALMEYLAFLRSRSRRSGPRSG
jgi:transcriptional regulator with XRE-family HTH domain